MEYVNLGRSGLKVSRIILGAMSLGSSTWQPWVLNEEEALPLLHYAYQQGINTWDTADVYSNGRSEEIIGKAIRDYAIPREGLVLMTKCYFGVGCSEAQPFIPAMSTNDGHNVNRVGLSRKHILDAVKESVRRLGTYIDVLQIHRLDDTPTHEIVDALHDVIQSGQVRYIGASTMYAVDFQELQHTAYDRHGMTFISMQCHYSLLYREEEREMLRYCRKAGVGHLAWSPVARGVLTRPLRHQPTLRQATDYFLEKFVDVRSPANATIVQRVEGQAAKAKMPMATVALAWCLHKNAIPIVGMNSKERIDECLLALKMNLQECDVLSLEEPYVPQPILGFK